MTSEVSGRRAAGTFRAGLDDRELFAALDAEARRQEEHIELIASENYVSPAVLAAQGSVLTNKYADGYPGRRTYRGCEHVDTVEALAIERAKRLFGVGYANVQPYSGSQANMAAYLALLEPGDVVLAMRPDHGGHRTHGDAANFSGRLYRVEHYGIDPDSGLIDYAAVRDIARRVRPKLIVAGFSAYSRSVDWLEFRRIADEVDARLLADVAHVAGLIAAGLHASPAGIADVITTTTHKTLRGPRGGMILANDNEDLNKRLNFAVFPESQGGPLMHVIAAKAICFKEAMEPEYKTYQAQVVENARAMGKVFIERGINIISDGTDNHLLLVNLIGKEYTGKDADAALGRANITVNKNAVPNDPRPAFVTSGLRVGTPAITTRGFKEEQSIQLTHWICDVLDALENGNSEQVEAEVKAKVLALCAQFPVYSD